MPQCPFCKAEVSTPKKEWSYRHNYYQVKSYLCPKCGSSFASYFHNDKFSHNIPKSPSNRFKISKYLLTHTEASIEEIAGVFNMGKDEVKKILLELQKRGIVDKLT